MTGDLVHFPLHSETLPRSEARAAAARVLDIARNERADRERELRLEDPEQLLAIAELLRSRLEATPTEVLADSEFFFGFLEKPIRPIGRFDEREYYLGEFGLLAGIACRLLAFREKALLWLDRAESHFVLAHNSSAHVARANYQKLAVRLEQRELAEVAELAERWFRVFVSLELPQDALKCRFLQAHALKETGRHNEAILEFEQIKSAAERLRNDNLAAIAAENLFQIHAMRGDVEAAVAEAEFAGPIFRRLDNRVNLAKLQVGVGYLYHSQNRLKESISAFREAQKQFAEIGMHADVAANHLVLADLLLDANQPAQAEWEIRAALPVIDELTLVPEGIAALSLLRDSVRRRQIDRQALRSLNGYFEELKS